MTHGHYGDMVIFVLKTAVRYLGFEKLKILGIDWVQRGPMSIFIRHFSSTNHTQN